MDMDMNGSTRIEECASSGAAEIRALKNYEENFKLPAIQALCQNPIAKTLVKYLDKKSCRAIKMTSKALDDSYHPLVKKHFYYKANVGDMTEKDVRANIQFANIRVNNLRIFEGIKFSKVCPFFEVMGANMRKLFITPDAHFLNIYNLCYVLRLVPNLQLVEMHVESMTGGGNLAACKTLLPVLVRVETISLKFAGSSIFSQHCFNSESTKAFVDLILMCPNLKQIILYGNAQWLLGWCYKFVIRYAYLRTGIVVDHNNITKNDYFVYIPVKRDESFSIQNFGEEFYLQRFIRRRDRKTQNEYHGDKYEWDKAHVSHPPNFLPALSDTDMQQCITDGFQFADVNNPTEFFGVDGEDTSSDEDDEDEFWGVDTDSSSNEDEEDENEDESSKMSDMDNNKTEKQFKTGRDSDDKDLGERVKCNCTTQ